MKVRRRAALLAMAALVAACTSSAPDGPSGALPSLDAFPGAIAGDRLLVLMDDGSIFTVGPDGEAGIPLRGEDDLDFETRQPVWSPDGALVAWVEIGTTAPPASSTLVTSRPDGSRRREVVVDTGTFFLQWDPTSTRLAYLGSFRGTVGMGVADTDADGGPVATTLGIGQPFYLSWGPEGDRLLIHVGTDTLGTLDFTGEVELIEEQPGVFHAPVWLADGRFVYAVHDGDEQRLVVRDGGRPRELVRFRGAIEFVVSPDGDKIAYRVDSGEGFGTVSVMGIDAARSRSVSDLPTSAFHWSPDGRRLLLMTPAEGEDPTTHRWHVWDGRETSAVGPAFVPSPTYLRDYMPFFGQFAQTMTLWAPDGRSFAFPGLIGDRAGIWVQDLDAEDPTFVVEDGSVVAWSPVAAP
ncbi:MAG: TolB family protein [Actinomycetota bacterium]